MAWELFTQKKYSFGKPRVTILKGGGILINKNCVEELIKGKKFLNLYLNTEKNKRMIGIKPTDKEDMYSYRVNAKTAKSGIGISAISFFKKSKIDYKDLKQRVYQPIWDEKEGMIVVSLEE